MRNEAKIYDRLTTFSFLAGTLINLSRLLFYVPVLNASAGFLYLLGNVFWFIASRFYPPHKIQKKQWYSFLEFREQLGGAALLGAMASICSLLGIVYCNPLFGIASAMITLIANAIWFTGEYNKHNNPPADPDFDAKQQGYATEYAACMTGIAFISAVLSLVHFYMPIFLSSALMIFSIPAAALIIYALDRTIRQLMLPTPDTRPKTAAAQFTEDVASGSTNILLKKMGHQPAPPHHQSKLPRNQFTRYTHSPIVIPTPAPKITADIGFKLIM